MKLKRTVQETWGVWVPCESRAHARRDLKYINDRRCPAYIRGKDVYPVVRKVKP